MVPHSWSLFRQVWAEEFPHVKIPKHDVFTRCTSCVSLSNIVHRGEDKEQRAYARALRDEHWKRVTTERRAVEAAKYKSLHQNEDFLFCEIDGMDSMKTVVPHFAQFDKSIDKDRLLKLHVTCVKYNGKRPDDIYYFTDAFPHDSANTITVMYKTLLKVIPDTEYTKRRPPCQSSIFYL